MTTKPLLLLFALAGCGPPPEATPPAPAASTAPATHDATTALPTESLYLVPISATDQRGQPSSLDVHRGHPVIVSMFYASCPSACPMLISDIRALERKLPDDVRGDLRVLLVSLDPERDTPEALAEVVTRHEVDGARWTLLRPGPNDVRAVASALGIRYRPTADGEMNHSSILTLLDRGGRPVSRLEGLNRDPQPLLAALSEVRDDPN